MKSTGIYKTPLCVLLWMLASGACGGSSERSPAGPAPVTGLRSISGTVADPGGTLVAGATVSTAGGETRTDDLGRFTLRGIAPGNRPLTVAKDGYETTTVTEIATHDDVSIDVVLPPVVRIEAGESKTVVMTGTEGGYRFAAAYSECTAPCKPIRVVFSHVGSATVTFRALDAGDALSVFTDGGAWEFCCAAEYRMPMLVFQPHEKIYYVRLNSAPAGTRRAFEVATTFEAHQ